MLNTILLIAGVLLAIGVIVRFVLQSNAHSEKVKAAQRSGTAPSDIQGIVGHKPRLATVGLGLLIAAGLMAGNFLFFYAEPGYSYFVQYPWGGQAAVMDGGYHIRAFGNLKEFKNLLTVKYTDNETTDGEFSARTSAVPVRFNDNVRATTAMAPRFEMPRDEDTFIKMAVAFRSQSNLIASAIIPFGQEVARNSARILSAQEFVVGEGGAFEAAVLEQFNDGVWRLDTTLIRASERDEEVTADGDEEAITIERGAVSRVEVNFILDDDGERVVKDNPLTQYGVTIAQAGIEHIDFEEEFDNLLQQQRDAAANANIARQEAQRAEFEKEKIIAQGETTKAQERVAQETAQIKAVIAAETKEKEAEALLRAEKLNAQAVKVKADADAYQRTKLMQADNALALRLEAAVQMNKDTWTAIGQSGQPFVPSFVGGGATNGGNPTMDFIQLMTLQAVKQSGLDKSGAGKN